MAGDLLDLVLSPDEVDQIYDLLSPDSEEDGQSDTRPDESAPSEPILADDDEEMAAGDAMN